jgi:hypothetical protein
MAKSSTGLNSEKEGKGIQLEKNFCLSKSVCATKWI